MAEKELKDRGDQIKLFGYVFTGIWFLLVVAYVVGWVGWCKFWSLKANEFGDFSAGVSAPLAFVWFVLAFRLQGEELKLQREELRLQREEQKRSREAQESQATSIAANELHARRDTFFRVFDLTLREMNTALSSITGNVTEAVWSEVARGNSNAFFDFALRRGAYRTFSLFNFQLLASEHSKRAGLTNFCVLFERLWEQVPDDKLRQVISRSPMAITYVDISGSLGRPTILQLPNDVR
ncbi:MAG: hypothetical protein AB7M05_00040 [Alphaproteobacteria bacterium]